MRLLRHALKQSAHLPLAWRGLCRTMVELGNLPEAEAAVRRLLKIEPENPQNWVLLGTVYTRLMRQADALPAFEEAARLNPQEVRLRLSIGHLHKTLGRRTRLREGVQGLPRARPQVQRSLLEPRRPEELRVQRRRGRGDGRLGAGQAATTWTRRNCISRWAAHSSSGTTRCGGLRSLLDRQQPRRRDRALRHRHASRTRRARAPVLRRGILCAAGRSGMAGPVADLRRGPAALGLDAGRADPRQPFERRRHLRAAQRAHHRAASSTMRNRNMTPIRKTFRRCPMRSLCDARPALHRRNHAAAQRPAALHRQDAEQLQPRGPHSCDAAECRHHRRAPPSDGRLLQHLQAVSSPKDSRSATTSRISAAITVATST